MKAIALTRAAEHLELAAAEIDRMSLEGGAKAYSQAWSTFLTQASRFYSKMEQGSKGCKTSEPWFGQKKHERRTDPLLSYIHHARDCDEHGLDYVVAETGSQLSVQMAEGATEIHASFEMMVDDQGKVHIRNPDSKTPQSVATIELHDKRIELVRVTDGRFKDSFDPPRMHLNRPIVDQSPQGVARLAIGYLKEMLEEASKLPRQA
ncbi:hypothetical protein [Sphingopyxis sp.]|uniref:hypothetical protein n=1 Tax=Sphingopyxis sp. TaxID=1908224 RepID=UPI002ED971C7